MRAPPNDQLVESRDWLIAMPCAIDNELAWTKLYSCVALHQLSDQCRWIARARV